MSLVMTNFIAMASYFKARENKNSPITKRNTTCKQLKEGSFVKLYTLEMVNFHNVGYCFHGNRDNIKNPAKDTNRPLG